MVRCEVTREGKDLVLNIIRGSNSQIVEVPFEELR